MGQRGLQYYQEVTVTIPNNTAKSSRIVFDKVSGGVVIVPGVWTAANIGFYTGHEGDADTDFVPVRTSTGGYVEIKGISTGASSAYPLPDELENVGCFLIWSKNTGSTADVNQGGARNLKLSIRTKG